MNEPLALHVEMVTGGKDAEVDLAYAIRQIVERTNVAPEAAVRVLTYSLQRYQRDAYQNQAGRSSIAEGTALSPLAAGGE